MPFFSINNIQINGIASCVPKKIEQLTDCDCLSTEDAAVLSASTGIYERRIADDNTCTSDLCEAAANKIIDELKWDRDEIDILIFVTQTPDYVLPATAPILQNKLGLSVNCMSFDISLGCSGYVYGLITIASLLSNSGMRKGLLLVGDTISKLCSSMDKSTYPLFGDSGTATALSFNTGSKPIIANMYSDGSGYEAIIIKDGARRNPFTAQSLNLVDYGNGIVRNGNHLVLDGMDVFSFGISKVPAVVKELLQKALLETDNIDYFVFHQANKLMNERIRKKLALPEEKVPYSLPKFGNTSCSSIPLTITTQLSEKLTEKASKMMFCGFGVGLSWGALYVESDAIVCPPLIEI